MTLLQEFKDAKEKYESMINEHGMKIIEDFIIDKGIKYPGLTVGVITGYTPGFNDGEPCKHSSYIELKYIDDIDFIIDELDLPSEDDMDYNTNLSREDSNKLERDFDFVDCILQEMYGTDYQFLFAIIDGELKTKINDNYDCGY